MVRRGHRRAGAGTTATGSTDAATEKRVVRHSWYASPSRIASRHSSMSAAYSSGRCRAVAAPSAGAGGAARAGGGAAHRTSFARTPPPRRPARPPTRAASPWSKATNRSTRSHTLGRDRSARGADRSARPRGARLVAEPADPAAAEPARRPVVGRAPWRTATARTESAATAPGCRRPPSSSRRRHPGPASSQKACGGVARTPPTKTDAGSSHSRERNGDERRRHVPRLEPGRHAPRLGA